MPYAIDASLYGVVGLAKFQSKFSILANERAAIDLARTARGWIDYAWNPITNSPDRCCVNGRFGLTTVILVVQIVSLCFSINSHPYGSRPLPAHIEAIAAGVMIGQLERINY